MKNGELPAHPWNPSRPRDNDSAHGFAGLTKREYFAGLAMQGLISTGQPVDIEWCVRKADELLKELDK